MFVSSPFARAHQTALACQKGLLQPANADRVSKLTLSIHPEVVYEDDLMERYFGRLDDKELLTYGYVWPLDLWDVSHNAFDVESVAEVCTRINTAVMKLETTYEDTILVLVSHADVCQITQLYAAGAENVGHFSQYRFGNGEVRGMKRNVESLPDPVPLTAPR